MVTVNDGPVERTSLLSKTLLFKEEGGLASSRDMQIIHGIGACPEKDVLFQFSSTTGSCISLNQGFTVPSIAVIITYFRINTIGPMRRHGFGKFCAEPRQPHRRSISYQLDAFLRILKTKPVSYCLRYSYVQNLNSSTSPAFI
jgi:hypothetical protein